jgi:hypothetical protein
VLVPRIAVTAAAGLGVLLLQGCGGSDSKPAATAPASSDFVAQLDGLCKSGNARIRPLAQKSAALQARVNSTRGAEQSKALVELGTTIEAANKISRVVIAAVRALDPPPAERKFFDDLVAAATDQQAAFDEFAPALKARDLNRVRQINTTLVETAARRTGLIRAHGGFKYCQSR